jgi:hypothetical protein
MATYYSQEMAGTANLTAVPVGYKPRATVYQARLKRLRATITWNTQTTSDTLVLGVLPVGATFAFGVITQSATMGASATLAIGNASSTGKYRAAATSTAADGAPAFFGLTAAAGAVDPSTAEETVIGTIAAASLPASGTQVIDIFYSMPN